MDTCLRPIGERVTWLFEHAAKHAAEFCTPDAVFSRRRYLSRYPTAIAVMKCMDGRINIPVATGTPPGVGMGVKPKPVFLKPGDVMTLGIDKLGEQRQKVFAWDPALIDA